MIKMSFYDGTLDRAKAREVVEASGKERIENHEKEKRIY